MLRSLALAAALGLALAAGALADGPQYVTTAIGGAGVTAAGSPFRYVTVPTNRSTVVEAVRKRDGRVENFRGLVGTWGIPAITITRNEGLSRDGRTLVLSGGLSAPGVSRFLVLGTKFFGVHRRIVLAGDFSFDALSPDARTLFLIQHMDEARYVVRAYDLRSRRLLPGRIADRRQRGWTMRGFAVARADGPGARWVYTLYRQPGNYPFIHALDTVARRAVCVAVPHRAEWLTARLKLDGHRLLISGPKQFALDTRTLRITGTPRTWAVYGL